MAKQTRRMRRKRVRGGDFHDKIIGSYDATAEWDPNDPDKFISQGKPGRVLSRYPDGSIRVYEWDEEKKILQKPPNQGGKTRRKRRRRYTKK